MYVLNVKGFYPHGQPSILYLIFFIILHKAYNMKNKILFLFLLSVLLFTSCQSYIALEKIRFKIFLYIFFGTLIIGGIGMLFIKNDKNE